MYRYIALEVVESAKQPKGDAARYEGSAQPVEKLFHLAYVQSYIILYAAR